MSSQSPRLPKFGDWDGESGEPQSFTLIFENVRADKSMKNINPNDPAFLAEYFNSSSASSQAVVHDADSAQPPPLVHKSPPHPLNPTSKLSMNQKDQSPHVPKFGDWDVGGENGGEQAFTLIFDNMHADKSMKGINPNDPAFLTDLYNPPSSSSSSQAAKHGVTQQPPSPLRHESPQRPLNQSSHVPKFGDWDVGGENGEQQAFTVIFDNMRADKSMKGINPNDPAFLADLYNPPSSSSSSQVAKHGVNQQPPSPLQHENPRRPLKPSSRGSTNHKAIVAPKFGNWDVERPTQFTAIFDELKEEKRLGHASAQQRTHTSGSPTRRLPMHKTSLMSWRLCFSSSQAVRD